MNNIPISANQMFQISTRKTVAHVLGISSNILFVKGGITINRSCHVLSLAATLAIAMISLAADSGVAKRKNPVD